MRIWMKERKELRRLFSAGCDCKVKLLSVLMTHLPSRHLEVL